MTRLSFSNMYFLHHLQFPLSPCLFSSRVHLVSEVLLVRQVPLDPLDAQDLRDPQGLLERKVDR